MVYAKAEHPGWPKKKGEKTLIRKVGLTGLPLEVQHADGDLPLGVGAGCREGPRVAQEGSTGGRHAKDAAVLLGGVLRKKIQAWSE